LGETSDDATIPPTQHDLLIWLHSFGFRIHRWMKLCRSVEDVMAAIDELDSVRDTFGFETDGAVIKLNDRELRERVGYHSRAPKWAKAWKYVAEQAETRLRAITVQVGRTGVLTPVAELDPVFLRGSTISRATLHNEDEIRRKDIRIRRYRHHRKAGEVIPAVVRVVLEKRPRDARGLRLLGTRRRQVPRMWRRDPARSAVRRLGLRERQLPRAKNASPRILRAAWRARYRWPRAASSPTNSSSADWSMIRSMFSRSNSSRSQN
jgi:NAD-dependent DNA ligase